MGGQGAAFYASARPGYFGAAGLFSAPLNIQRPEWPDVGMETQGENPLAVFGDPSDQRFYWAGHNPIELLPNLSHSRLFVIVGDGTPGPGEVGNIEDQLGERYLLTHSEEFVPAARAAGVDVTYERRLGIHDWPDWREHLAAAIRWGFFRKVPARARTWTYKTVARRSWVWGVRIVFQDRPPTAVATFRRRGDRISATGVGRVRVRVRGGGSFTARLPFNRRLPARR
jgi:hypothetical protein